MPKSAKRDKKHNISNIYKNYVDYAENEDYENDGDESEEELKHVQIQEAQTNNITQNGMIVTKNGDVTINSLTIIGIMVIVDNNYIFQLICI